MKKQAKRMRRRMENIASPDKMRDALEWFVKGSYSSLADVRKRAAQALGWPAP